MSLTAQYRSLLRSVDSYSRLLEQLSEAEFQRSPAEGTWSYAEVYSHIFQSNLLSVIAAEKCINGTAESNTKPTNWKVMLILFFGRLPPGKFKVPQRMATMVTKITKEEAVKLIVKLQSRLQQLTPSINKSSSSQKAMHPRLGLLNARQWFRFIQIHTLHHQKQLERISKMLEQTT